MSECPAPAYLDVNEGQRIAVYRRAPPGRARATVLYVHGATFPAPLAIGFPFDGRSWMDDLVEAGFDTWAFDFMGFGASSCYPAMKGAGPHTPPLGRAPEATAQLEQVVWQVLAQTGEQRISLIAHSWGSQPASRFATEHPDTVGRLVLFGPILERRLSGLPDPDALPAWRRVSLQDQWKRFVEDVPAGVQGGMLPRHFEAWGVAYLATDAGAASREPPAVAIPTGPQADIMASWSGRLAYDPAAVRAPTLVVRGAWDSLCTDADVAWLRAARNGSGSLRDVVIPGGTHLMHLEPARVGLHKATRDFLLEQAR